MNGRSRVKFVSDCCLSALCWVAAACGAAGVEPGSVVLQAEQDRIEVIERIAKPTLSIFGADSAGGGSGVVISPDGYALTNFHVVQPCGNHLRCGMNNGQMYDAIVVGIDPTGDVALIKLVGRDDFPSAELGDSDRLEAGQTCYVVGNPFVLATDFQPTVTYGIISGVHRYQYPSGTLLEYADCIQTDASINPGNSGGPLFNAQGQLVGVNGRASFEKRGRVNVGVGYAISINQIKKFMGHLRSGRIVDHATLGFTVANDDQNRLTVSNLLESSDAYRRGVRIDDEIAALGGRPVRTVNTFKNILGTYPKGWRIPVTLRRGGKDTDVLVRLSGVHSPEKLFAMLEDRPKLPMAPQPKDGGPQPEDRGPRPPRPSKERPIPPTKITAKQVEELPASVQSVFEQRHGYANYYFNRQNVNRLWQTLKDIHSAMPRSGDWTLSGKRDSQPFNIELNDNNVIADLPEITTLVDMSRDLDDQLEPPGSGGMLVALQMWRRFLTLGPEKYGEMYYLGTAPLQASGELRDVLVGLYGSFETRFYFSRETGRLEAVELFPSADVDPCELYLGDYRSVGPGNVLFPFLLKVRVGDVVYGVFQINQATLSTEVGEGEA